MSREHRSASCARLFHFEQQIQQEEDDSKLCSFLLRTFSDVFYFDQFSTSELDSPTPIIELLRLEFISGLRREEKNRLKFTVNSDRDDSNKFLAERIKSPARVSALVAFTTRMHQQGPVVEQPKSRRSCSFV